MTGAAAGVIMFFLIFAVIDPAAVGEWCASVRRAYDAAMKEEDE